MTSQRGFSLVEALIALLVLSLGLVGVAAMQLKALQSASLGYQRSVASVAAADAQERLWATLEPGQGCDAIDVGAVQTDWRDQWFEDSDHTPLRNAIESDSGIEKDSDEGACRFTVTLALSEDANDQLDYTFRLPSLEGVQ
ncbi:type IV pilus modification PilV family protein [Halomonas sp. HL-93]|uniref:type IV pilus modification PilV family protein n=1 Tax=Halomonas sp. HL-93 TaxID=1666906 RepID=UPI0006DA88C1|nr:prepilin-type N-terminal cleavage/methylation domain-containing protein [Halomonas sp. HL-93]KPQ21907.1 MAG: type IV pilus modification protein PilV [Halomonas sp. HL-93]SBR46175.1 type IV pilus assembly protein PilV [Halomonas sp. HL-93]